MLKTINTHIVSACTLADAPTFSVALTYINKYIDYHDIIVSVPDTEYDDIKKIINNRVDVKIIVDSEVLTLLDQNYIRERLVNLGIAHRYGWYIQQFVKIQLLSQVPVDAVGLIWDADTIPLRPLKFVNRDGTLNYFTSYEYHEPYFNTILRIFNLPKQITDSYIAQCFPIYGSSVKHFIETVGGGESWVCSIMKKIHQDETSENLFSEYETLGTFLSYFEPEKMHYVHSNWSRNGAIWFYLLGSLDSACSKLQYRYAYVAFEKIYIPWYIIFPKRIQRMVMDYSKVIRNKN